MGTSVRLKVQITDCAWNGFLFEEVLQRRVGDGLQVALA